MPKKLILRAHFEAMKGTQSQAMAYCEKDGDFHQYGDRPKDQAEQGRVEKENWAEMRSLAVAGDFETLGIKYPKQSILYDKNFDRIYAKRPRLLEPLSHLEVPHLWFYGPPGSGKSLEARTVAPLAYIKNPNTKWWDGYNGEDDVIIDDFDKYQVSQGGDMKRWLDIYAYQAETKGSQTMMRPKRIIVTSNYHPSEIWDDQSTVGAISRRVNFKQFGSPPSPFAPCFNKI